MTRVYHKNVAVDDNGDIVPGAEITVRNEANDTIVNVYAAKTGGTPLTQPFTADGTTAIYEFYVDPGVYRVTVGVSPTAYVEPVYALPEDGYLTADGTRVVAFDTFADMIADTDTYTAGTVFEVKQGGYTYLCTDSTGDLGQTTAGGQELDVQPGPNGYDVLAYGCPNDNSADVTPFFNRATRAAETHGGNGDLAMRRDIYVPPGDYKVSGTIYVQKGQRLKGAGDGTTRIRPDVTSTGRVTFKLGAGIPGGVETGNPGGLPPIIEKMHTEGGDTTGAVVEMTVAGAQCRDMFITSPGVGINIGGGDTITTRCFLDGGLTGVRFTGQNHIFTNNLFFNLNYGIIIDADTVDTQIQNCHFEYTEFNDILFDTGDTGIKGVLISNCQFIKNIQYSTSNGAINFNSNGAEAEIKGCTFRNQKGASIIATTGNVNTVSVTDCIFNGDKTASGYTQSTTARGISTGAMVLTVSGCEFVNLHSNPITMNSASASGNTKIRNCTWRDNTGASYFCNVTGSAGTLSIMNCVGDRTLPMLNSQDNVRFNVAGCREWLGAPQTASSRYYWEIPTWGSQAYSVGLSANTNPAGNPDYRKSANYIASRHVDNSSGKKDFAESTLIFESSSGFAPVIDVDIELDSVGGGLSSAYAGKGRLLVVSIPDSYADVRIEAENITF